MHSLPLSTGAAIPQLGFGTYQIPAGATEAAVSSAFDAGYRHVDTAEVYRNEAGVGRALRAALPRLGLRREEVFLTTKLWPKDGRAVKSGRRVAAALDASLAALGVDSVDLYLIHAGFGRAQRLEQWQALTELHAAGKARAIGVSNFGVAHLRELLDAGLPVPHANQIELHPWSQKPELVAFLRQHDVLPIAYSSLAPLAAWRSGGRGAQGKSRQMREDGAREDSELALLAAEHGVSQARLLLRWAVQQRWPVLPKSTDPARQRENADVFGFELDDRAMARLAAMDRGGGVAWGRNDPTRWP